MCVDVVKFLRDWSIPGFICTGILAIVALLAPYYNAQRLRKRNAPKLDIEFDKEKYLHLEKKEKDPCYYCHFMVVNSGLSQADDCEAVLEKIWKKQQRQDFIPVNLKWSCEKQDSEKACFKTIYPGKRRYFGDIVRVTQSEEEETKEEKGKKVECTFELARTFISQDTFLKPCNYEIQISVYSKNAARATKKFDVKWLGGWSEKQKEMQEEHLKIKML